ncbi:acyltransferase family protein [Sphingomonas sp.]|uniref:acyltransferase family protein n=1 Tax=Sphingomonas sp. TaxID=28214 RepID=UPI003B3BA262
MTSAQTYRPDIDGLRAVAVVAVLFYHSKRLGGGFVGVDVFFVISGYLITGHLRSAGSNLSVMDFCRRRIRRIAPALLIVLIASMVAGIVLLLPRQLAELARTTVSVLLWVSNIRFWKAQGYFASEHVIKPLLHTWSLAVEEQFYLLIPFCIKYLRRPLPLLIPAAFVSFILSVFATYYAPGAAFYLLP